MGHKVYQLEGNLKIKKRKLVPNLEIFLPDSTYSASVEYEFDISTENVSALLLVGSIQKNGTGYGEDIRDDNGGNDCDYKSSLKCGKILRKKLIRVGEGAIKKGKKGPYTVFFHEQDFGLIDRWIDVNCIYQYFKDENFGEDIYEFVKNCVGETGVPAQPGSTGSSILI